MHKSVTITVTEFRYMLLCNVQLLQLYSGWKIGTFFTRRDTHVIHDLLSLAHTHIYCITYASILFYLDLGWAKIHTVGGYSSLRSEHINGVQHNTLILEKRRG